MNYIGNFSNWIQDTWIQEILSSIGQARPRDWPPAFVIETAEYKRAQEAGYDLSAVNWWVYEEKDVSFKITPPWVTGRYHWWITKLTPGQYMPMHTDPHTHESDCVRYWIPFQDYVPGHIFVYKDQMMFNYKRGDVYSYHDSQDLHGAANIGHSARIVLQVTEYRL
jgi:hypothetical protein